MDLDDKSRRGCWRWRERCFFFFLNEGTFGEWSVKFCKLPFRLSLTDLKRLYHFCSFFFSKFAFVSILVKTYVYQIIAIQNAAWLYTSVYRFSNKYTRRQSKRIGIYKIVTTKKLLTFQKPPNISSKQILVTHLRSPQCIQPPKNKGKKDMNIQSLPITNPNENPCPPETPHPFSLSLSLMTLHTRWCRQGPVNYYNVRMSPLIYTRTVEWCSSGALMDCDDKRNDDDSLSKEYCCCCWPSRVHNTIYIHTPDDGPCTRPRPYQEICARV